MNTWTPYTIATFGILLLAAPLANAGHEHQAELLKDKQAPMISYQPASDNKQQLAITVDDNAGIRSVTLIYHKLGSSQFQSTTMKRQGKSNSYIADLGKYSIDKSLKFDILAVDLAGNSRLVSGNAATPIKDERTVAAAIPSAK